MSGERSREHRKSRHISFLMGNGNLIVTQFVLNSDFTNLGVFAVDQDGDGDKGIGIGGIETKGLLRGPA